MKYGVIILIFMLTAQAQAEDFYQNLVEVAKQRTKVLVVYNGSYRKLSYPGGDVPNHTGVCTDLIIRAYRSLGFDLQKAVHEDMREHFSLYPSKRIWGLSKPDSNIDHRRVPNLQTYFSRFGQILPVTEKPEDYQAGDLVTWRLSGGQPHIGLVADKKKNGRPMIIHNIGWGPKMEDALFDYEITGHYRFQPDQGVNTD